MRDIKGYEGLYAVTSCGRVWSYKRNKFLKPIRHRDGYLQVNLRKNGIQRTRTVHRIVAEAYISNPENLPQVNHKDEVKTHNWINNLEWCSAKYNTNYGTRNERCAEKKSFRIKCVETDEIFKSLTDYYRKKGKTYCGDLSKHLNGKLKSVHGLHFIKVE